MKSRELLSIVLSIIMVFGVSAGSAYAQTDSVTGSDSIEVTVDDTVKEEVDDDKVEDDIDSTTADEKPDDDRANVKDGRHYNLDERLGYFCDMTNDEKRQFFADHPRLEQFSDRLANYCDLSGDERDDKIRDFVGDYINDEDRDRNVDKDLRHKLARYCELSDEDKREYIAKHDKTAEKAAKMNEFCTLNETDRADYIAKHRDEYKAYMKDKMRDVMTDKKHMDYDRLCALSESDRALEFDDSEKLDRLSNWCNMTPEEREEYKKEKHDSMKEKMTDMKMDKVHDKMKMSDMSPRLKAMIMEKRDISDERTDEIRMKYKEKYGDYDAKKSELKIKFKNHMATMKIEMSAEHKSAVLERVAEMKAFKIDLRERSSELSDKEKQELRAEFIEKAKDIQLAWISPRHQMNAGIDAADIECREGFSHVMKESNGRAMCVKADTALKMIDRGIAVPAI